MQISELPTNRLAGAVLLAVIGAAVKFYYDAWSSRRANRLQRVNRQLELLYGPMLALTHASREAWYAFRSIYRPDSKSYWLDPAGAPTPEEATAWRVWMKDVFMPLDDKLRNAIVEHSD